MKKYLLIAALLTTCQMTLLAQDSSITKRKVKDSLEIDRLQKKLPSLKDTARINCLNEIAKAFLNATITPGRWDLAKNADDSGHKYADIAYREATQTGYKYGIAQSLMRFLNVCNGYYVYNRKKSLDNGPNWKKFEEYQKQLFDLASQMNDAWVWGMAYWFQSDFLRRKNNSREDALGALKNAASWFIKAGDEKRESNVCSEIAWTYCSNGEYEKGFDYCNRALQLAKKMNKNAGPDDESNEMVQEGLENMSDIYRAAGDYETALDFLRESGQLHATHNASNTWDVERDLADMFLQAGQYDSCFYYLKAQLAGTDLYDQLTLEWIGPILADAYLMTGRLDSALYYYDRIIDTFKNMATTEGVSEALRRSYYGKAKILVTKNDYKDALAYAKKSYAFAQWRGIRLSVLNNYDLLSELFHHLGKNDSAYFYSRKYILLKDSILTRQFFFRLNNYKKTADDAKKEAQIGFLNRDNKIKEQQVKQQTLIRNFLFAGLFALILIGIFVYRALTLKRKNEKLKNEKIQTELQQRAVELEMQALRAQMNPHFIFNCLNAINRFIFINEPRAASDYLTRFSRLIRMVLLHSQKKLVALEDELEMLRLYLDMERLRFKNAFDYSITTTNAVETNPIFIPPLLLQPFCENAIWHGLLHKDSQGHLNIEMNEDNGILHCIITDDGVGREKAEEYKSKSAEKEKSLGLKITKERLSLLNQGTTGGTFYEIEDILDENNGVAGTRVQLKIRYKECVEEYA